MKIPIILTTLMLMANSLSLPALADSSAVTTVIPNQAHEEFIFDLIDPVTNKITFRFKDDENIMFSRLVLASYDFEKYTIPEVDANLGKLGVVTGNNIPYWASDSFIRYGTMDDGGYVEEIDLNNFYGLRLHYNLPGRLYYAVEIIEGGLNGYWVRGVIDYHDCVYNSTANPALSAVCVGEYNNDLSKVVYKRRDNTIFDGEVTTSWSSAWEKELKMRLTNLENEIKEWDGAEDYKIQTLERLDNLANVATDADHADEILAQIDCLKDKLENPIEPDKEEERPSTPDPDISTDPDTDTDTDTNTDSNVGPDHNTGSGSDFDQKPSQPGSTDSETSNPSTAQPDSVAPSTDNAGANQSDAPTKPTTSNGFSGTTTPPIISSSASPDSQIAGNQSLKSENDHKLESSSATLSNPAPELPSLHGEKDNKWWAWVTVFLVVSLSGGTLWWVKRAFGKSHLK